MTKILLIGNERSSYGVLSQQLQTYNYTLTTSIGGGDQGILRAIRESPDLILVDSDLAIIDGWQVIKIIKASTVTRSTPVIVLMSPTDQEAWQKVLQSDCDDYCLKPVGFTYLLGKIQRLVGHVFSANQSEVNEEASFSRDLGFQNKQASHVPSPISSNNSKPEPLSKSVSAKPLVIYIEDHQADSLAMAKIVQNKGYSYANIVNPLEALPKLLELKPKLIFLDLVMPLVNGYELCAQIRRMSVFKTIPIIIVTNNDGIADRVRAKVVGASGFLGKPIRPKRVGKVLAKYLQPVSNVTQDNTDQPDFSPLF
ncbi:response regulator [Leptolyngbya ectocarpi]|nr:response regulator [Leptolyngbya ectocarpi]